MLVQMPYRLTVFFGLLAGILISYSPVSAQPTWTGGNGFWNDASNWSTGFVPSSGSNVFINSNASNVVVTANGNISITSLTLDAGDQLNYFGGFGVSGFSLQSTGGLTNNGLIHLRNGGSPTTGALFQLSGTHTNSGNILVGDGIAGDTSIIYVRGNTTLTGGGTVTLSGINNGIYTMADGGGLKVLTIANQSIDGLGQLGGNNIGIVNQAGGLIDANSSGNVLVVDPGTTTGMVNQGIMRASGGGILELSGFGGGGFNNVGGVIRAQAGSEVRFGLLTGEFGEFVSGGVVESQGTGVLRAKGNINTSFKDLTINGNMIVDTGTTTLGLSGSINNTGNIFVNPGVATLVSIQGDTTLTGGGSITLGGTGAAIGRSQNLPVLTLANQTIQGHGAFGQNQLGIINQASGMIDANVAGGVLTLDHRVNSQLVNQGTLRASNGGTLLITDSFSNDGVMTTNGANSLIDVNAALINNALGSIRGSGELEVTSLLTNDGLIAPGNSAGALAIDLGGTGLVDFSASSALEIELASSALFDTLSINGLASLDGNLNISLLGGYVPVNSDLFQFLTASNATGGPTSFGTFANVANGGTLLTAGGEGFFTVNYVTTGSGSLARLSNFTIAIPEPATTGLMAIGLLAAMFVRRPRVYRKD